MLLRNRHVGFEGDIKLIVMPAPLLLYQFSSLEKLLDISINAYPHNSLQRKLLPKAGGAGVEERGAGLVHGEFTRRSAALALLASPQCNRE